MLIARIPTTYVRRFAWKPYARFLAEANASPDSEGDQKNSTQVFLMHIIKPQKQNVDSVQDFTVARSKSAAIIPKPVGRRPLTAFG